MSELPLTPEQEAEAQRVAAIIRQKIQDEALTLARMLVSKRDEEILGQTEFELRDRVHQIGAVALQTALEERKKRATKVRV